MQCIAFSSIIPHLCNLKEVHVILSHNHVFKSHPNLTPKSVAELGVVRWVQQFRLKICLNYSMLNYV